PDLIKRVEFMDEISSFQEDVARIYHQMLLCQETEKIDKKMREEIIPEMLKNVSSMRNMRFGFEENEEENDDKNPDWADAFEQSGLGDKLREMNELQLEGADVYMSTFAALKSYPFFREVQNWFYPFSKQQSDVIKQLKQEGNEKNTLLDLILQSGFFSNSDKYSLFFTIRQLPKAQQDMMLSQLGEQQVAELSEKSNAETMKKFNERPGTVSNQYLHDLYRFFKLSVRRHEFRDIFKEKLDLHHIPALNNVLYNEYILFPIADFYLKKERWNEAIEVYEEMETIGALKGRGAEYYQKLGYALQKNKKYAEAIDAYLKADTLKPDNIWNNRHLAICYRLNRNYQAALSYYKKVEEATPESTNVIFHIGSCLAELGQYEEAANYFFKLDFIESNCIKAWRGIGWCSFISRKYEQAMKYYEKIIGQKPLAIDYMNAGHVAWAMGDIQKAAALYGKSITANGNRERFLEMFRKDEEALLKQGIQEEDIPLMLDLL
ncbi:tetratricopeptide repeat protein, partial [Bacteroides faecis]